MATQVSLNSGAVASAGALALQTNGTTEAVSISTGQVATLAQNPILTSGTANGVAYLNGSKVLTTGSALVFDGSNLGLGVTPSAWGTYKAFQLNSAGYSMMGGTSGAIFGALGVNYYFDGTNYKYINASYATQYNQSVGAHTWSTAPSGTAGNAITFTQAMTLDASGQLQLGTTSNFLSLTREMSMNAASGTVGISMGVGGTLQSLFYSSTSATYVGTNSSTPLVLQTGGSERARIDSSGNFFVNTTAIPTTQGFAVLPYSGGTYTRIAHNTSAGASDAYIQFHYNSSQIGQVQQNGTTAVQYTTTSDYRLKENVQPMTEALAKVAQLKPVTYTWKSDGSDGQGFIAHELQEVVPDCVGGAKDAVDEDGNPVYQGIDTSFLVATLTAAIQEQQAIIQSLTDRISALEGTK